MTKSRIRTLALALGCSFALSGATGCSGSDDSSSADDAFGVSESALTCSLGVPSALGAACARANEERAITAGSLASATPPLIEADRFAYGVRFVGSTTAEAALRFVPLQTTHYNIFLGTPNLPFRLVGPDGPVAASCSSAITAAECNKLRKVGSYALTAGATYRLEFGPTTAARFVRLHVQTRMEPVAQCAPEALSELATACTSSSAGSTRLDASALSAAVAPAASVGVVYGVRLPAVDTNTFGGQFEFTPASAGDYQVFLGTPKMPLAVTIHGSPVQPGCSRGVPATECNLLRRGDIFTLAAGVTYRFALGPNVNTSFVRVTIRREPAVDECAAALDNCDDDPQACVDTPAGFECACPAGFTGDGVGPDGCTAVPAAIDLSKYKRVARYPLPEPSNTTPPNATNLLAQEASAVTYNWDTDTLFITGDGARSVVQVSKTGALVDTMTLAPGGSPQGTEFYDTEGIAYVGGGKFVMTEERDRQAVLFSYVGGATLQRTDVQTVKLGTTIGNIGLEGVGFDLATGRYLFVKEATPKSIFDTGIDFAAGTATNGSPTATGSVDLFDPALVNTLDFSDVYALTNLPLLQGNPTYDQLLMLSQESGQVVQVDRAGSVKHTLTLVADPSDVISIPDMTIEGLTLDRAGNLYLVSENGGGDINHPELWVYAPSSDENLAPTAISLPGAVTSLPQSADTTSAAKLADIFVTDDGLGDNALSLSGPDAASFQIIGTALFLRAGTVLNAAAKPTYDVTVNVEDATVGATPDASTSLTLTITGGATGPTNLAITEVAPWSSGNSPLAADWFEVTNLGTTAVTLTGWTVDDSSNSAALSAPLSGVPSIAPGESVIFIETADLATKAQGFVDLWFGGTAPAGLQIGSYTGGGIGLSTGGDALNLFDGGGTVHAAISFGASPGGPFPTFANSSGLNNVAITTLSAVGQFGAFAAAQDASEIGSPGTVGVAGGPPIVGVTAADGLASENSGDTGVFRFTRSGSTTSSLSLVYAITTGAGQATPDDYAPTLTGSLIIPSGSAFEDVTITAVDDALLEGSETLIVTLSDTGNYDVGAGAAATVTILDNDALPVGGGLVISEVAPWSSGNSPVGADWFEVTNTGSAAVDITGWKVDDGSHSFASALALNGVTTIAPGEAVLFLESASPATAAAAFRDLWYGTNPQRPLPQIGSYTGSGIGLSSGGDEVVLFDAAGALVTGVAFGASPAAAPFASFDNHAGVGSNVLPFPVLTVLSSAGINGALLAVGDDTEVGSPGIGNVGRLIVTEVAPWGSSGTPYAADWFEVTNIGSSAVSLTDWKVDDSSNALATGVALTGITSIAPGESVIFIEGTSTTAANFVSAWFGASAPAGFQIGSYSGSGIGLSSSGDAVNLFNAAGNQAFGVSFGASTSNFSFDNATGITTAATLSAVGVNGAFLSVNGVETGSPGKTQ